MDFEPVPIIYFERQCTSVTYTFSKSL